MDSLPQNAPAVQLHVVRVAARTHRVTEERFFGAFHHVTTRCGLTRERRDVTSVSELSTISCEKCASYGAVAAPRSAWNRAIAASAVA